MMKRQPIKRKTYLQPSNSNIGRSTGLKKSKYRLKAKKKDQQQIEQEKEDRDRMWDMFREIYQERGPYSELSGEYLGPEPLSWMFDHILEKSKYPNLKYEKENIIMVTFREHQLKTDGFPLDSHKKVIQEAKEKFDLS